MKSLKKTTRFGLGRAAHHHIAYVDDDNKVGSISFGDHTHELIWEEEIPEQPEQQDPETGEIIPAQPGQPGRWVIAPDPDDGHSHELEEYEVKEPKRKQNDDEIVQEVIGLYRTASEIELDSHKKGDESDDFYFGEQWKKDDRDTSEALGRPCLTINLTTPKIDHLSGEQRQARTDIHYTAIESGDQVACDLYNIVSKQVLEQSRFDREESKVFLDQLIPGRGTFNLYVDFTHNLFGDIRVEHLPRKRVRFGPHDKEDLSDCEYLVKHQMFSKAKLEQIWPDKADDIGVDFDAFQTLGEKHTTYANNQYAHSDSVKSVIIGDSVMVDIAKKEYRVLECWRKTYVDSSVAVQPQDEFTHSLFGWDRKDVEKVKTLQGFVVVPRSEQRIRITKIAGGVLLSDENPAELPVNDFFVVPAYAYKRGCEFKGKVEDVKDLQREINKRHSQSVDIINKCATYGYGFDSTTFPNDIEKEKFIKTSSSPGFMVELTQIERPPHRFEGVKFPAELAQLMQSDIEFFDRILNIQPRPAGANTSSAAIIQEQKMKLIGNEFLFDNLWFAKSKLGMLLLHTIRKYYTPDRIYRIVNNVHQRENVTLGDQSFEQFTQDQIVAILENADITKFDVAVSESTYSPTTRIAILSMIQEMMKNGVQGLESVLVQYFDIPESEKQKILANIQAAMEAQSAAAEQSGRTEIVKTLVGQGIIPPEVEQQFNLNGQAPEQQQQEPPSEFEGDGANGGLAQYA